MVGWHGRHFLQTTLDGDVLPDAFVHDDGLLPHLHGNLEELFPKAHACEDMGDKDPFEDVSLETRGIKIGRAPEEESGKASSEKNMDAADKVEPVRVLHQRGEHHNPRPEKHDCRLLLI